MEIWLLGFALDHASVSPHSYNKMLELIAVLIMVIENYIEKIIVIAFVDIWCFFSLNVL